MLTYFFFLGDFPLLRTVRRVFFFFLGLADDDDDDAEEYPSLSSDSSRFRLRDTADGLRFLLPLFFFLSFFFFFLGSSPSPLAALRFAMPPRLLAGIRLDSSASSPTAPKSRRIILFLLLATISALARLSISLITYSTTPASATLANSDTLFVVTFLRNSVSTLATDMAKPALDERDDPRSFFPRLDTFAAEDACSSMMYFLVIYPLYFLTATVFCERLTIIFSTFVWPYRSKIRFTQFNRANFFVLLPSKHPTREKQNNAEQESQTL